MEQIKLKIQLFNTLYKCVFCDQWKNALKSTCHALSKMENVRTTKDGKVDVTITISSALVCDACFQNEKDEMELMEEPLVKGPEIVLPR